jgi:hypothetical protein
MKHQNVPQLSNPRASRWITIPRWLTNIVMPVQFQGGKMNKVPITIFFAIFFVLGLVAAAQFNTPAVLAQSNVINVCSQSTTNIYNIHRSNAASLRAKLDNPANFGPNGAYGEYDFEYIDVGDNFTKQTILDNKCNIWFSGFEADGTYTDNELNELQSWVNENNGQVIAGCDDSTHDPVCDLLNFAVTTDTDTFGFLTNTAAENPLNCNGALGPNSQLEMAGGVGGYFSGDGVTPQNGLAVHETDGAADPNKPIVVYTGNFFFTADINMIQSPTLSNGPDVTNNNDILAMNAFSALADASVGKEVCSSVELVTHTPEPTLTPTEEPTLTPSEEPTLTPSEEPTATPTTEPTATPTVEPTTTPPALPTQAIADCSWGDVHIRTPDGLTYNFQEVGDFVLMQSTSGDVMVQARQEWNPNPKNNKVSINRAVALNVAGDRVELYLKPERPFYVNGELTNLPASQLQLSKGGIIYPSGNEFTIVWPDGNTAVRVVVVGKNDHHLNIGVARLNGSLTYEGICGNLDGKSDDDMQIRGGAHISSATNEQLKTFGDSWLAGSESLFHIPFTSAIDSDTLITQSASNVQFVSYSALSANQTDDSEARPTLLDLDPAEREAARQICQNEGITDLLALNTCTYDVAATQDEVFVESAQTFQTAMRALPEAERRSVPAIPSQGLFEPVTEPSFLDQLLTNPAGLLTNPAVLGVLGVLLLIILLRVFRRRR